jgi:hypothetical protein
LLVDGLAVATPRRRPHRRAGLTRGALHSSALPRARPARRGSAARAADNAPGGRRGTRDHPSEPRRSRGALDRPTPDPALLSARPTSGSLRLDFAEVRDRKWRVARWRSRRREDAIFCCRARPEQARRAARGPTILPPLTRSGAIEVTIHSTRGAPPAAALIENAPFRAPHHGIRRRPGGRACGRGPETPLTAACSSWTSARVPARRAGGDPAAARRKQVCIVRVGGAPVFPSDFLLVAAMNPCPCEICRRSGTCVPCDWKGGRGTRKLSDRSTASTCVPVPAVPWAVGPRKRGGSFRPRACRGRPAAGR